MARQVTRYSRTENFRDTVAVTSSHGELMPVIDKKQLHAFAKKASIPSSGAAMLAQKRAAMKAPATPVVPGAHPAPPHPEPHTAPEAPHEGEGTEKYIHELVEEAAQEAEASADHELEDLVAGYTEKPSEGPPEWATDAAKWTEAAEAVGLGTPDAEDRYDEPFVVTAYLYKKLGGMFAGAPAEASAAPPESTTDMTKPGAAAKALHARSQAKAISSQSVH